MVRYASRAPSIDHQWATYVRSTSSVWKRKSILWTLLSSSGETGTHPTFVGPVGQPVHYMPFLVSAGQTQSFAGHAWHVVDISVEHIRLERTEETRRVAGFISGCWTSDSIQEGINHRPAYLHKREPIHSICGCAAEEPSKEVKTQRRCLRTGLDDLTGGKPVVFLVLVDYQ